MKTLIDTRWLRPLLLVAAAVLVLGALGACGPSRPKDQNFNTALDTDTVTMMDTHVTTNMARQDERTELVNGFLKVYLTLRNLSGKNMHLEIKTVFKDQYGTEIPSSAKTWEPFTVSAHEDLNYSKLCPNQNGRDYHIYIRLGEENR